MNIEEAKRIPIIEHLNKLNIQPVKRCANREHLFYSPFRKEHTPSFYLNLNLNLWKDFGDDSGGSIIDLVKKQYNLPDLPSVLEHLSKKHIPPLPETASYERHEDKAPVYTFDVRPLRNPVLIDYLKERKINIEIAEHYCIDIYFKRGDQRFFAIGFKNNSGGYEVRNKHFKGSVAPEDITTIRRQSDSCLLFEGFIDFLSYLTIKNTPTFSISIIVLNPVAHLNKALPFLKSHSKIYSYLDNDTAGKDALTTLLTHGCNVTDQSPRFSPFKDLNEYLCRPTIQQKKQQKRGFRL